MDDYYPVWLGQALITDDLPWEQATSSTFPSFLEHYSVHDSYWIGLYLEPQRNAIGIVRWDTFWTKGIIPFPGSRVAEWPLLIMRFSGVLHSDINLQEDGIAGATSAPIHQKDRSRWGIATDLQLDHTQIEDHRGGIAELLHHPQVAFLCLSCQREVLSIPLPAERG